MARVDQAFTDQGEPNAISLNTKSVDYRLSATIIYNVPAAYAGYGVGGALANNGHAKLVNNAGARICSSGKLLTMESILTLSI